GLPPPVADAPHARDVPDPYRHVRAARTARGARGARPVRGRLRALCGDHLCVHSPLRPPRRGGTTFTFSRSVTMRLDSRAFGLAAGAVAAVLFTLCALAVAIAPTWTTAV